MFASPHGQDQEIGDGPVSDPKLLAGDDEVVVFDAGASTYGGHIRAACGLADRQGGDSVARHRGLKELAFLFGGAEFLNYRKSQVGLHQEADIDTRKVREAQRVVSRRAGPPIHSGAAPAGLGANAEKSQSGSLLE